MKLIPIFFLTVSLAAGQTIETRVLTPKVAMRVTINPAVATTILLPAVPSGTFGLGLVSAQNASTGVIQLDHPEGSSILVLHPLIATAHIALTVLMDSVLYVFDVVTGTNPDIALTYTKTDTAAPRAQEVTPAQIVAERPQYDPEIMISLLRRARDAAILAPIYHDLYSDYSKRECFYTSENTGVYKTTVTTLHRFSKEDAVVLQGTVENLTDKPLVFDARAVTILCANEVHPAKLVDCLRPIPAHAKTLIDVLVQGDVDGSRANLSIQNEYRIMLPGDAGTVWNFKNGSQTPTPFKVPKPMIPMVQTKAK